MHEASLVAALLRQVVALAELHDAAEIVEVRVVVGPLAGVEPQLLHEAFERLKLGTIVASARLTIDAVGLSCVCCECRHAYTTAACEFRCPSCQSTQIQVTGGDAVLLESVTLSAHDEALQT